QPFPNPLTSPQPTYPQENDVWTLDFTRYCSGDRGNTCTGPARTDYDIAQACTDLTSQGQTERCEGPSPQSPTCLRYGPMNSFEYSQGKPDLAGNTSDGICNENYACSTISDYASTTPGLPKPFLCQATCGNGLCKTPAPGTCTCNSDTCGATCEHPTQTRWQGTTCSYGCQASSTCSYTSSCQTPCPQGSTHCLNDLTCYYDVACAATYTPGQTPCAATPGDSCPTPGTLTQETCHFGIQDCTANGTCTLQKDYCPQPGTVQNGLCHHGSRACDATGGCTLQATPPPTCPSTTQATCTPSGWTCT
ncbi:MAG: hypothetical protein HC945_04510, partial [Nitrosarchaeum sp.]|nr:hypothetical protein [Nitrosarchaeum sp.]